MVWVGISASKVDGAYFFEGTVNQFNYVEMLKDFFAETRSEEHTSELQSH